MFDDVQNFGSNMRANNRAGAYVLSKLWILVTLVKLGRHTNNWTNKTLSEQTTTILNLRAIMSRFGFDCVVFLNGDQSFQEHPNPSSSLTHKIFGESLPGSIGMVHSNLKCDMRVFSEGYCLEFLDVSFLCSF